MRLLVFLPSKIIAVELFHFKITKLIKGEGDEMEMININQTVLHYH